MRVCDAIPIHVTGEFNSAKSSDKKFNEAVSFLDEEVWCYGIESRWDKNRASV